MFGGLKLFFDRTYGIDHLKHLIENEYIDKTPEEGREEKIQLIINRIVESALQTAGYIILK